MEPTFRSERAEGSATEDLAEVTSERCLDCAAPVVGAYCQRCGQRHGPAVESVGRMFGEAVSDLFGADGRLFRTLGPLFRRPGFLTNEYVAGRHTRYVPPFRLYLACSLLYFAVFFATGSTRFFFVWIGTGTPDAVIFLRRLPQLMFVAVPVFALMVSALYRRSRRLYAAHVVFALHFHAFAFLMLMISAAVQPIIQRMVLTQTVGPRGLAAAVLSSAAELLVVVYLYLALRGSYGGSRTVTLVKAVVLMVGHVAFLLTVSLLTVPSLREAVWRELSGS